MHRYRLRPVEGHRPIVGRWPSLVSLERGVMMGVPMKVNFFHERRLCHVS